MPRGTHLGLDSSVPTPLCLHTKEEKEERKAPTLRLWLLPLQCFVIAGTLPDVQPHHAAICCRGSKNPESFLRCKPFEAAGGSPIGFTAPLLFVQVRL